MYTSFQEQGQPGKRSTMEAGREAGPVAAAHGRLHVRAGGCRKLADPPETRSGQGDGQTVADTPGWAACRSGRDEERAWRILEDSLCIWAARGLAIYPRAAKHCLCFDTGADCIFTQVSPSPSWSSDRSSDSASLGAALRLSTPHRAAACPALGRPQQPPCHLQELGASTGLAVEPQQRCEMEVSYTQSQKSSCGLVNQRYETHGGLYPDADILKAAPSH